MCGSKNTLDISVTNDAGFGGYCKVYSPSGSLLLDVTVENTGETRSGSCDISGFDYVTLTVRTPAWGADGEGTIVGTLR